MHHILMYEILLCELKLVSSIFVFSIRIKLLKNHQKWFYYTKKAPFILKIFKFLYIPLTLFSPFLDIADFIEKVDT